MRAVDTDDGVRAGHTWHRSQHDGIRNAEYRAHGASAECNNGNCDQRENGILAECACGVTNVLSEHVAHGMMSVLSGGSRNSGGRGSRTHACPDGGNVFQRRGRRDLEHRPRPEVSTADTTGTLVHLVQFLDEKFGHVWRTHSPKLCRQHAQKR